MSTGGFSKAMPHVLVYEGGKVDDPRDPGGRTNQGVIQRVYTAWRLARSMPDRDVDLMTNEERDAIYRKQYWDAIRGDELPAGVDFVVFDGAVNSGPKQSIKWLQRAVGVVADGVLGAITLAAVADFSSPVVLVDRICDRRMEFLKALKTFKTFGRGWTRRVDSVRATGQAMANSAPVTVAKMTIADATAAAEKAPIDQAKETPGKGLADTATGGGVASGGLGFTLQQLQEQLTPFSMAGDWIGKLVVGLLITSAVLTIGGLAYRWYAARRKAKLVDALDAQPEVKIV